jgi:hypothetical protein
VAELLHFVTPDAYVTDILAIDPKPLFERGYRAAIVDLDNTLVAWHSDEELSQEIMGWFNCLAEIGFSVCLVSNNFPQRVTAFADRLDIPSVPNAGKPTSGGFLQAIEMMGASLDETLMIGDQLFTDVLGGNRLGLYTILVVPITRREFIGTRLVRIVESWVLRLLVNRGRIDIPPQRKEQTDG